MRRIGISVSERMFFPSQFRAFLPLGPRSPWCACHVGYAWQAQKEDVGEEEKRENWSPFPSYLPTQTLFFRSPKRGRPFDFKRDGEYGWFRFGKNFFSETFGDRIFSLISGAHGLLLIYNGVRIFPVLYAMNFLPSKSVRRENFFPEITDPPTPASKVNWSSPKLG